METMGRIIKVVKNKYVYTTLAFFIFMIAFDRNHFLSQYRLTRELQKLRSEKQYYIEEIKKDSLALQELKSSLENLEKFGRERYYMKKDDEDLFVIIP